MDSGTNYAQYKSIEERERLGLLPKPDENMSLELIIDIMDQLLCCQVITIRNSNQIYIKL